MPAEILSLDLDWFNNAEDNYSFSIREFFATLRKRCKLPPYIDFVPEHQYLYPWTVRLLDRLSFRKANVINIDEHHDFYCLDKIDFESNLAEIGCWNFFAFMAHRKILGDYTWVTSTKTKKAAKWYRTELMDELKEASSSIVRSFKRRIKVVYSKSVFDMVAGRQFDGFMIIRSPEYTENYRSVYHAVDQALAEELSKIHVRRYKCRTNFKNGRVHHRANSLFWEV